MTAPLAYFLTWTTYGNWLPGDERGWITRPATGIMPASRPLSDDRRARLGHAPIILSNHERETVHDTIVDHCTIRGWTAHAVNVRTNHVHVVVSAKPDPDTVAKQFKAWCSRRLNALRNPPPRHWWTRGESTPYINSEAELADVMDYVLNRQ